MQYRRFGKTNLFLSIFSLGTMRYLTTPKNAYDTINATISHGINHLETARGYGQSEEFLGRAFAAGLPVPRSQLYITTKIPPTEDADTMNRYIDESLARLNVCYIDCLGIHGINTWEHLELIKNPNGCMQAVWKAIDDGRVKHIGFSTHAPLEVILATINTDFFEFVNLHYYYFFQRNAPAVELAYQKEMGVFIISPSDKGGRLYTPPPTLVKLCHPFSPLEINYRFLLSDSRITTLSVGAGNPDELIKPLQTSDSIHPLTEEEKRVFHTLADYSYQALGNSQCSQCYKCLPCPENINIPEILRLRNLTISYNMKNYGEYRYGMLENSGHWFPGMKGNRCTECGDCLPRCPENLDIPSLLQDTHTRLQGKPGRRLWG
ncbi:aldo/keto reductase [Richelia intracellularis]|nr:aldo/keto reductase [Richelia intracellularis]